MELNKLLKRKQKASEEGNEKLEAEICSKIGTYYYNVNKLDKAITSFKEEAHLYEKLNMNMDCGKANRMIAEVYIIQGKFMDALKHEDIYMKAAKEENDLIELQRAYATLGRILLLGAQERDNDGDKKIASVGVNCDVRAAEKAFLKSLIISKELSKDLSKFQIADMQSRIYLNLGVTKEEMNSYDEAIDYYKTALKLCKANDLFEFQYKCLMCIGLNYSSKHNDVSSAMQYFNMALDVAKRIDDKNEKMCETLIAKSDLLIKNGDYQSAKKFLKKAFKLKTTVEADMEHIKRNLKVVHAVCKSEDDLITTDSLDYETRKRLFERLGDGSCKLKNYKKGIDFYQKQLEAAQLNGDVGRTLIPIYISLYQTYTDIGEYENALKYVKLEYELIKDEPKEACTTLATLANLLHMAKKDFWDVDATYRKALSEARKAEDTIVEGSITKKLVALCKEHGMTSLAEILENEADERGVNINLESEETDMMTEDLLDSNDIELLDFELSSDPDSSDDENSLTPKTTVRKKRSIPVKKNAKGETKLHEACINGNYHLVKMLLDQGHPVNIRDNAGWMCIHEASNHGHRDIVELLLDNGAQSSINDKGGENCDGITPLYDAASNGHLSIVKLLLERGAKATMRTDSNQTPLDALVIWYNDNVDKLTTSEKEFYEEIKDLLVKQYEKVGMETAAMAAISSHPMSSGYSSIKSKGSQSNMRFNEKFSDTSDEDENDDGNVSCSNSKRTCRDNNDDDDDEDSIKKNARHEYKSVMQKLKHPHMECGNSKYSNEIVHEPKKRSAYLSVKEVAIDDWLDDDLGPNRKKQKKFFDENLVKSPKVLSRKSSFMSGESDNEYKWTNGSTGNLSDMDVNSIDAFHVMMNTNGEGSGAIKKSRRNSNTKKIIHSNQSSLLDAGFTKFTDFDDSTRQSFPSPIKVSSNNSSFNDFMVARGGSSMINEKPPTIIKVQIEGEKIIVPINMDAVNELKIKWLIDESARRYCCLKGIRPEIKLKTADGAKLIDDDPLSLALCLTDENLIFSEILDWKLPSLSSRYLEACSEFKYAVDEDINELLNINRTSTNIDLSNQNLHPLNIRPIFKAFHYQHCLNHINISNNFILDEGLKYLTQALVTLKTLSFIDLSGNGLTENGIEYFTMSLVKSNTPVEIKQLKLNFNPIKSTSLKHLSLLCRKKFTTSLSLVSCKLIDVPNEIESFYNLQELNISYNHFTVNGLKNLLEKLNSTCIESLIIDRCTNEMNVGDVIVNSFLSSSSSSCESNTLKELDLSGLRMNENEILDVLRCLKNSVNIESLNLSYMEELTMFVFKFILFKMSGNLSVKLIGCRKLMETFQVIARDDVDDESSHPCHIKMSMPDDDDGGDFMTKVSDTWLAVTNFCGRIHQDNENILHLLAEDRNVHEMMV